MKGDKPRLSALEGAAMQVVWSKGNRRRAARAFPAARPERFDRPHDPSPARRKGYVEHDVEGRTYVYHPRVEPHNVAAQQVRGIINRFCRGSVENLLLGMVDDNLITPDKLRELAERIEQAEAAQKNVERGKN